MFDFLAPLSNETVEFGMMGLTLGILGCLLFLPPKHLALPLFALPMLFLGWALLDVMRLQPWAYQYSITGIVLGFYYRKMSDEPSALDTLRWLMIFTYFWSGVHKLNIHFREEVFVWLTKIFSFTKELGQSTTAAYSLGVIELVVALLLIFSVRKIRVVGIVGLLLIHLLIVSLLIKDQWNPIVLPWNFLMMGMVVLLFGRAKDPITLPWRFAPFPMTVLLLGLLPTLYMFEMWVPSMSLNMYAGTAPEAVWYCQPNDTRCIPEEAQEHIREYDDTERRRMYLDDWSADAIYVPVFAVPAVYRRMTREFCSCMEDKAQSGLELTRYPRWSKRERTFISCEEILKK